MNNIPNIKTEEDLKAWILTHSAESSTFWREQIARNVDIEKRLRDLEQRVLILATVGGFLGSGFGRFFF